MSQHCWLSHRIPLFLCPSKQFQREPLFGCSGLQFACCSDAQLPARSVVALCLNERAAERRFDDNCGIPQSCSGSRLVPSGSGPAGWVRNGCTVDLMQLSLAHQIGTQQVEIHPRAGTFQAGMHLGLGSPDNVSRTLVVVLLMTRIERQ